MNTFKSLFFALVLLVCATRVNAQTASADYFPGKWNVLVKGTPQGDAKMVFVLENKDGKLTGIVHDDKGQEISKITNAESKENEATLYFTAQGYDLNLVLTKKDENHVTGSLMGMFDAEGERVK